MASLSTGLIPLTSRALVALRGSDCLTFLQGMTTQDMTLLTSRPAVYTMFLTGKGRVIAESLVYAAHGHSLGSVEPADYLLECDRSQLEELQKHLLRFRLRSKVALEPVHDRLGVAAVVGEMQHAASFSPLLEVEDPRLQTARHTPDLAVPNLRRAIIPHSAIQECSEEAYHTMRRGLAMPEGPLEVESGKGLPFECNVRHFNGVCLFKGCYMGQELTARTFFTGEIRKRLLPLRLSPAIEKQLMERCPGPELADLHLTSSDGQSAGRVLSSAHGVLLANVRLKYALEPLLLRIAETEEPIAELHVDTDVLRWIESTEARLRKELQQAPSSDL